MDISDSDLKYLGKALSTNRAVLFVGAGFSADATNRAGKPIPVGSKFAEDLWTFLKYSGDYDGTALQTLFEAALKRAKPAELRELLQTSFLCSTIPDWCSIILQTFWYRIYGTNIDDVVETAYNAAARQQELDVFNAMKEDFKERDQFLARLQYIKLNGTLPGDAKDITFSAQQYANRMNQKEPWYDHFVRDYSTRPTIFIGSTLNEPLLNQAIAARSARFGDRPELRPRGFLVVRHLSQPQEDALKDFKLIPLIGEAREFFELVRDRLRPFPSRQQVLVSTNPSLQGMFDILKGDVRKETRADLQEFYASFKPVARPEVIPTTRKLFLQGAEPTWVDIHNHLDAPREFTRVVVAAVEESLEANDINLTILTGAAGSGKSTLVRRAAATLADAGHLVFFADSEELPAPHRVVGAISALPKPPILVFDNMSLALGRVSDYLNQCRREGVRATFLVAGRTSKLVERMADLRKTFEITDLHMPDLSVPDIDALIALLDHHNQLGKLANKPLHEQRAVFQQYAHHQLLVALRWATLGRAFDEIIKDEFLKVEPVAAQMMYLCTSLATAAEFSLSKQQIIATSSAKPAEALAYLEYNLRDIVIPTDGQAERFLARHRAIADHIVEHVAPRAMLRDAYIRLLKVLSHDLSYPIDISSRTFRLYQRLINHASIYRRFSAHLDDARAIYETLAPFLKRDYHFLLQYGSLELEYGELDIAANYIEQAYAYAGDDRLVANTRGYLRYKQAYATNLKETAEILRAEAREILLKQLKLRPRDTYAKHMLCSQELNWINHWLQLAREKREALENLRAFAETSAKEHPESGDLQDIFKRIKDAYLDLARPIG